jgi:murein DD-endopeptidase MepM/ murein hydrolase activator NlpD
VSTKLLLPLGLAVVAIVVVAAGAASPTVSPGASAQALAIKISIPGSPTAGTTVINAPPASSPSQPSGFSYPADGSIITTGPITASASTTIGQNAVAQAQADLSNVSIFQGDITVTAILARANATTSSAGAQGGFGASSVLGLQALGETATFGRLALGDWGYLTIDNEGIDTSAPVGASGFHGFVTELDIVLNAAHGGLPAGSEIQLGYADVQVQTAPSGAGQTTTLPKAPGPPVSTTTATLPVIPKTTKGQTLPVVTTPATSTTTTATTTTPPATTTPTAPSTSTSTTTTQPAKGPTGPVTPAAPVIQRVTPPLTAGPYVFPVFGASSYTDTYGAPRADVTYHHGDDIFGALGQPILAVANGVVFSVGWNNLGGNRLWLRDDQGNDYYYAHLSAFAITAVNGAEVKAGDVIGFMGDTGDAEGTPTHLHFEIHPVSLLSLGYDGAVDPTTYLNGWKHLTELATPAGAGWAPSQPGTSSGPAPGAYLVGSSDISSADGLDPSSYARAISALPAPATHP